MEFVETNISGAFIIKFNLVQDERGKFIKTFHKDEFNKRGLINNFAESYFSTSKKNVIRGMHFQVPPFDHAKFVYLINGKVEDVLLDIRRSSPTYGKVFSTELTEENNFGIYIPSGVAHGFSVKNELATMVYMVTTVYSKEGDSGIHYNSFGYDWKIPDPLLSSRDRSFNNFSDFISPFN